MFFPLHTYTPSPILITIGPVSIHWYGLLLAVAILFGYFLACRLAKKHGINQDKISSIYTSLIIWGFVGARVYHVLNDLSFYLNQPAEIIKVWHGGLAIHGAIIAGVLTLYYYAKQQKLSFWVLADLFSLPLILGQAVGRWGNYFNQELFGKPTDLAWGIPIAGQSGYFHPTFLYESLWDFLVLGLLYYLWRKKTTTPNHGMIFWTYITLYSVGRFLVETLRINQTPLVFGYRWPALVSLALAGAGIVMIIKKLPRK